MAQEFPDWLFPDWQPDRTGAVNRTPLPESGGWMLKFRDGLGMFSHVFVPDVQVWADRIAASIAASKDAPVAVVANLDAATHRSQPVPKKRGS